MRILNSILFTALVSIIALSCKSTTTPAGPTANGNSFYATGGVYSNALFNSDVGDAINTATVDESSGSGAVNFGGTESVSTNKFSISILVKATKPATYIVSAADGVNIAMQITQATSSEVYFAINGTIQVASWDAIGGRAKGSFQGRLVSTTGKILDVTNGKFDCKVIAL